eukprot:5415658-Amphidinium_carterae.1
MHCAHQRADSVHAEASHGDDVHRYVPEGRLMQAEASHGDDVHRDVPHQKPLVRKSPWDYVVDADAEPLVQDMLDLTDCDLHKPGEKTHWCKGESVMEDTDAEKTDCVANLVARSRLVGLISTSMCSLCSKAGYRCNAKPVALNVIVRWALHL